MNTRINTKLLLSLLAVLAINHTLFQAEGKSDSRDFASKIDSEGSTVSLEFENNLNKGANSFTIVSDDSDEKKTTIAVNLSEGRFTVDKSCSCGVSIDPVSVVFNPKNLKDIAALKTEFNRRLEEANTVANKKFEAAKSKKEEKEQLAEDVQNCVVKNDKKHTKIKDTDQTAKLKCFKEKIAKLKGDQRDEYQKDVVEAYLKKNVLANIDKQMWNPRDVASQQQAKMQIEKLLGMNLVSDDMKQRLDILDKVATTNLLPSAYQRDAQNLMLWNSRATLQAQQSLDYAKKSGNKAWIKQATDSATQLKNAYAEKMSGLNNSYLSSYLVSQSDLANMSAPDLDTQDRQAIQNSLSLSRSNAAQVVNGDPHLKSAYGNYFSQQNSLYTGSSGMFNPSFAAGAGPLDPSVGNFYDVSATNWVNSVDSSNTDSTTGTLPATGRATAKLATQATKAAIKKTN